MESLNDKQLFAFSLSSSDRDGALASGERFLIFELHSHSVTMFSELSVLLHLNHLQCLWLHSKAVSLAQNRCTEWTPWGETHRIGLRQLTTKLREKSSVNQSVVLSFEVTKCRQREKKNEKMWCNRDQMVNQQNLCILIHLYIHIPMPQ